MNRPGIDRRTKGCSRTIYIPFLLLAGITQGWAAEDRLGVDEFLQLPAATAFRNENYEQAADLFAAELDKSPENIILIRYLAISHYRAQNFKKAEEVFTKGLALAPDNAAMLFFAAQNDLANARRSDAIARFKRVLELAPNTQYEREARTFLEGLGAVRSSEAKSPHPGNKWRAFVQAGYEYDSNIIAAPEDAPQNRSGHRVFEYLSGSIDWLRRGKWVLKSGANVYVSQHEGKFNDFNLVSLNGETEANYKINIAGKNAVLRTGYEFNATFLDDESYSTSHRLNAGVFAYLPSVLAFDLDYQYSFNEYRLDGFSPDISSRDGNRHEMSSTIYAYFDNWRHYGWAQFNYDLNSADGHNFDHRTFGGEIGAKITLPAKLRINGRVSYENIDYKNYVFTPQRKTKRTTTRLELSRELPRQLFANLAYYYGNDDSTVPIFDYDRHIFTLSMSKTY